MKIGQALGWNPRVVDEVTLWELVAAIDGHNRANGGEDDPEPPSDEDFDRMLARAQAGRAQRAR